MDKEQTKIMVEEVINETQKQFERAVELWGFNFDDKNTANDWTAYICYYVTSGAYSGRQEAYTPKKFREHLAKAAGLCLAGMLAIDRNSDCAPRHYENLPNAGAITKE